MELLLGSHVREHGNRVGRLAGFELEPATLHIRRILYSPDGELGPTVEARPLAAVALVHDDGEIELRPYSDETAMPAVKDIAQLTRATRVRRAGRDGGRLAGVEAEPADRSLRAVFVRPHWWSRRFDLPAPGLDFSVPGEIRAGSGGGSRAA
jgi:hypothetical protein